MLESIKRLFARPVAGHDFTVIADWARRRGHGFKRVRDGSGFVVDGELEGRPWRLEWGPPQRGYIEGHELRLRIELDLPSAMQMLLLSRTLMHTLERQTFEDFTDDVKTQIGTKTPEEMRWLVMFPKVNLAALTALRGQFGAVGSVPASVLAWLEGPLANQLEDAASGLLRDDPPFVLMTLRGRAYLRMQLRVPDPKSVAAALAVFETGVAQALRVAESAGERISEWNSSRDTTSWQSFQPEERVPPKRR